MTIWCIALTALITLLGLAVGSLLGLPGWSPHVAFQGFAHVWLGAGMTLVIVTPLALVAGVGRGYLAPLGFAMLLVIAAQVVAATGRGALFPWAVPALYAGLAGRAGETPTALSFALVIVTGLAGIVGTLMWWLYADFSQ